MKINASVGVLVRDQELYFIPDGVDQNQARVMVGPIVQGPRADDNDDVIGLAIEINLATNRILSAEENNDPQKFEDACRAIGFSDSNSFFRNGKFVEVYLYNDEICFLPSISRGQRQVTFDFLEKITASQRDHGTLGHFFKVALSNSR